MGEKFHAAVDNEIDMFCNKVVVCGWECAGVGGGALEK